MAASAVTWGPTVPSGAVTGPEGGDSPLLAGDAAATSEPPPPLPLPLTTLLLKLAAMTAIIVMAVLGNLLVIVSVLLHRRIRVVANCFVVSLAFADMLVALCAMTFNASIQITGRWMFGYVMCDMWNSFDVFFSTVSILHLCCISVDRYCAIMRPLEYRSRMNKRTVAAMLTASWTAPVLISFLPIFLGWYTYQSHLDYRARHPNICQFIVNRTYMLVSSTISFWLPGVVMVCMYSRIYQEARRQHRAISRVPSSARFSAAHAAVNLADMSDEQLSLALTALNNIREEPEPEPAAELMSPLSAGEGHGGGAAAAGDRPPRPHRPPPLSKKASSVSFGEKLDFSRKTSTNSRLGRLRYSTSQMLREHKAAKTLGVIMGCFVLCWLPFFSWYATTTLCGRACHVPPVLVDILFWIGYFNSTLNPMIYAYFNTEFREAFRQTLSLLCCRRRTGASSLTRPSNLSCVPSAGDGGGAARPRPCRTPTLQSFPGRAARCE
ncbi:octopamine receptor beta-1R-like [Amphibalanus amphitrite]|uniref:octopamine receptor beta-1R-like n=1 Tax=Amphibalanus amphitrite TaxID=1232801 RepID=UPI001C90613C|nr:octopamine receptor beta-1R-like [Amphibalanus amphitrite]